MQPGQDQFGSLFLHTIRTGHGVHAHAAFQDQALAHLQPVLELLSQAAPAHHLELAGGIIGPEAINAHGQFRHRSLIVLCVAKLGELQHFSFQQTVIHAPTKD
jgi:hypothetical protein